MFPSILTVPGKTINIPNFVELVFREKFIDIDRETSSDEYCGKDTHLSFDEEHRHVQERLQPLRKDVISDERDKWSRKVCYHPCHEHD